MQLFNLKKAIRKNRINLDIDRYKLIKYKSKNMKDLLKNYLGREIKLEPFYYGSYTLFDVTDNYFVLTSGSNMVNKKYIPYTSIVEIDETRSRITITLISGSMDEFLDNLSDRINSY